MLEHKIRQSRPGAPLVCTIDADHGTPHWRNLIKLTRADNPANIGGDFRFSWKSFLRQYLIHLVECLKK